LGLDVVGVGTLTANIVHPRETFESAIRRHASHVIVSHNHPSGICDPSDEDISVTKRLVEAGKIMGIQVLDHVIVSTRGYYSFVEHGQM
jgi:DNA repair protein RadC